MMITRNYFFLLTAILTVQLYAAQKPNIVVFLSDDQAYGDLSVKGNTNLSTPNVDNLAAQGLTFEYFYVQPVCSPTRAEFLTGRYHPRSGVNNTGSGEERMDLDETTVANIFKKAGYLTGAFGKWHNGGQYPYHPMGRGFDQFYGFTEGHWGDYFSPPLDSNGRIVQGNGFTADDFSNKAMAFIESNKDTSFLCYITFNTPHSPMQVPDEYWNRFKTKTISLKYEGSGEDLNTTRAALAMCENIDWNVGRVMKKLDELNLADNTIVLYFSDNGPAFWRWNHGLRGKKGTTDEGGVRSPLFMRWPGHFTAGKKISRICGAIDLLPTLAELSGITFTPPKPLDGISLAPLLTGNPSTWADRVIINRWKDAVSARNQQYRLDAQNRLYDITADPGQTTDVSSQKASVATTLKAAVAKYKTEVLTSFPARPFTIGHPDFPYYYLPAGEADYSGNVQRSADAPNCSFLKNWKAVTDLITWNVAVIANGRFDASVYYACPAGDTGSRIELSFNGAKIEGRVSPAWNPPLRGMEHDRVPSRGAESYVKDWKVLNLGTINLVKGTGTLALRALFVPGTQVMEFRELSLIRHDTTPPAPVKSGSNDSQDRPFSFNLSGNGNALQLRMNRSGPVRVEVYSTDGKLISRVQGGTPDGAGRSIILPLTTRTKGAGIVIFRFRMDNELYTARYALVN